MTMQMNDYVYYNGKKYHLVALEKQKSLVNSADFNIDNTIFETACYRGYFAEYFIEKDFIFGIKHNFDEKSAKMKMMYTGSMIIAFSKDEYISAQFIDSYLDFDEALELYFIDGELVEITDLAVAIEKWKQIKKKEWTNTRQGWDLKRNFATEHLQYEYDDYKYTHGR